jgi:lipocalin-like protein
MRRVVWIASILSVIASGPAFGQTPADRQAASQLVGTWRLLTWTQYLNDGTARPSPQASKGYIIYADSGHMCALLTNAEKAADGSTRPAGGVSYCARVQVHAREGLVEHIVEVDIDPTAVGIVRKRRFNFDGPDRLTLKIDAADARANPGVESTLVFERIRPGQ